MSAKTQSDTNFPGATQQSAAAVGAMGGVKTMPSRTVGNILLSRVTKLINSEKRRQTNGQFSIKTRTRTDILFWVEQFTRSRLKITDSEIHRPTCPNPDSLTA